MNQKNVTQMTRDELYIAIHDKTSSPEFVKSCIKEECRRVNELIQQDLKEQKNRRTRGIAKNE